MAAILNFNGHIGFTWVLFSSIGDSIVFFDPENIGIDNRIVYLEALMTKLYDTLLILAAILKKVPSRESSQDSLFLSKIF